MTLEESFEMTSEEFRAQYGNKSWAVPASKAVGRGTGGRKRSQGKKEQVDWTAELLRQIQAAGLPEPTREYTFHVERLWRFDLSWKKHGHLVACEIEGGVWMQTETGRSKGHAHPKRFLSDCEKYNEAALYGWAVIRVTPEMIQDGRAIDWLQRALLVVEE